MLGRHAQKAIQDAVADTPVVLIHGPRQAGKSTLAKTVAAEIGARHVTLDDLVALGLAQRDPRAFLQAYPVPVLIDEVQRAPELFLTLKLLVDKERRPGMFILTGSANVLTLPKLSDSLAGRMEIVDLLPFSQGELDGSPDGFVDTLFESDFEAVYAAVDEDDLLERLTRGGFPEPALRSSASRRSAWFSNYIRTVLERDVKDLANIEALSQMPALLSLLASRTGAPLNMSTISVDTGLPYTSLRRYLGLLEQIFLLRLVSPWSVSGNKALAKTPKAYLVDTGLLCYLANLGPRALKEDPAKKAAVLENFVAMELAKQCSFGEVRPQLMHLRTIRHLAVDFVLEARGGRLAGIDVKAATTLHPRDADGLRFLKEIAGDRFEKGVVLYLGDEVQVLDEGIYGLPLSALWSSQV